MSLGRPASITGSWVVLIAITLVSVGTAEYSGGHRLSVGIVMAIAAVKSGVILQRFMDVRSAPPAIRAYLTVLIAVCATMIVTLYCVSE